MKNRLITILGAGESGVGAAILAKKLGYSVFVSDFGKIGQTYKDRLMIEGIDVEENGHSEDRILTAEIIIKSPGISPDAPIIQSLKNKGIPIISEIEWASRHTKKPIIAITGSNGKSTTTTLVWHLLTHGGISAALTGNIGHSLALSVAQDNVDVFVTEVSSFQLEDIQDFAPYISVILNITPDHLDRYHYNIDEYANAKFRIYENQMAGNFYLYPISDEIIAKGLTRVNPTVTKVAIKPVINNDQKVWVDDAMYTLTNPSLQGLHNASNALFAIVIARIYHLPPAVIQEGLHTFKGLPHRMEAVGEINGIKFINDSKATNVDSVFYALEAQDSPVIWIAGGVDKGNNYDVLTPLVATRVKKLICLGINNQPLHHAFGNIVQGITEVKTMKDALAVAINVASEGDVVLLSPACASFDLFNHYIHRGEVFKEEFEKLKKSIG
jgi:UDP-N-acetylmuramoylalanine--D-glutamate ligase